MTPDGFIYDTGIEREPKMIICFSLTFLLLLTLAGVQLSYEHDLNEFVHSAGRTAGKYEKQKSVEFSRNNNYVFVPIVMWEEAFYDALTNPNTTLKIAKDAIVHVWTDEKTFALAVR